MSSLAPPEATTRSTVAVRPLAVMAKSVAEGRLVVSRSSSNRRVIRSPANPSRALTSTGPVRSTFESLMTSGTPPWPVVKVSASLPRASWMAAVSSPPVGSV